MSASTLGLIIKDFCNKNNLTFVSEYKFCETRRWRSDFYIPELSVLVEFEGLVHNGKGGHQTKTGYTKNCEKYNEASILGFKLLRYTALNQSDIINDLKRLYEGK
jgi:very-short-patch-repair endonuclease